MAAVPRFWPVMVMKLPGRKLVVPSVELTMERIPLGSLGCVAPEVWRSGVTVRPEMLME